MVLSILQLLLCGVVAAILAKINREENLPPCKDPVLGGLFSLMKHLFIPCCCDFCSLVIMHVLW